MLLIQSDFGDTSTMLVTHNHSKPPRFSSADCILELCLYDCDLKVFFYLTKCSDG